jgi:subtilisin-like proprotein convertase family protein
VSRARFARLGVAAIALVATALIAAPAGAQVKTKTYSSGAVNAAIPDGAFSDAGGGGVGTAIDSVAVRRKGRVTDLNVSVRITHPYNRDLEIWLMSPNRTIVKPVLRRGGSGNNFGAGPADCSGNFTVLDDQAATPIAAAVAPMVGSFVPDQPLAAFNGQQQRGRWLLFVVDSAVPDTGTLHCWELAVTSKVRKKK